MPLGPLPSLGPFGRVVDVRVYPHGFTTWQGDDAAGPAGSAIVRPNLNDAAWHAATSQRWGGNILWTGSTPRHTVAYNGPRGRWFGPLFFGGAYCFQRWFSHNGHRVDAPSGMRILGAAVHVYEGVVTATYDGAGDPALTFSDPPVSTAAIAGIYTLRCTQGGDMAQYILRRPGGTPIAALSLGDAPLQFDGELRFTLSPGVVPPVAGDEWQITVEEREQFVVVCAVLASQNSAPVTEYLYRRGVSLATGWVQVASIPPVADQGGGSIQPWFFNADATQAVTCRGLAGSGAVARTLAVLAGSVSDIVEIASPPTTTQVYSVTQADQLGANEMTEISTSDNNGPARQLMALDFDGMTLLRIEIEFDGFHDGTSLMKEYEGQVGFENNQGDSDVTATYSGWADLLLPDGRIRLFEMSGSGNQVRHWAPHTDPQEFNATITEVITVRVLRDVADAHGARIAYTEYSGTEIATDGGNDDGTFAGSDITMRHYVAGSIVAEVAGNAAGGYVTLFGGFRFMGLTNIPGYPEIDLKQPQVVQVYSRPILRIGELRENWSVIQDSTRRNNPGQRTYVATGGLPTPHSSPVRGHQTSATDVRGNWLVAAEIAAPIVSLWPGSFPGSGTYTDAAGGPDGLTPATVISLTVYPGGGRWNVGVF